MKTNGKTGDNAHETRVAPTHHACTEAGTGIGAVESLHRNGQTVSGVVGYIRRTTEPNTTLLLSVPKG